MRIYELARELGLSSKELLAKLPDLGLSAKSHSSSLDPEGVKAVLRHFRPEAMPSAEQHEEKPKKKKPKWKKPRSEPAAAKEEKTEEGAARPRETAEEEKEVPAPPGRTISISEGLTVKELAEKVERPVTDVIMSLMNLGVMASANQRIPTDVAEIVAVEYGFGVEIEEVFGESEIDGEEDDRQAFPRPPIVTVMGHVDHGKTLLLDAIRNSRQVDKEYGGITQHIGATMVEAPGGTITFIDTPGHEAFTAMRARGAMVTDMVILVVAADDGVMPQTDEAIHHAKAADCPIIVAVNKMDLPNADSNKVREQLAAKNLVPEEWGGTTLFAEVSAKDGRGIKELLESVILQAEMLELKAPNEGHGRAVVIEARLDRSMGPLGTAICLKGRIEVGDAFVCGTECGKVRALIDSEGNRLDAIGPSSPAVILGFGGVPEAGDHLDVVQSEKAARKIASERARRKKGGKVGKVKRLTLEDLNVAMDRPATSLAMVLKADTQGSVEAIKDAIDKMGDERVSINLLHAAPGAISDSDINLAAASDAMILAFNVRPSASAENLARREKIEIRTYRIIYELLDDLKKAMTGLLEPVSKEETLGRAEVRQLFKVPKFGTVAGCHVNDGRVLRNASVRLVRDGTVIYEGRMGSLRRFKDDVREVASGFECGIKIENYNDVKVGDIIEAFRIVEEAATPVI